MVLVGIASHRGPRTEKRYGPVVAEATFGGIGWSLYMLTAYVTVTSVFDLRRGKK